MQLPTFEALRELAQNDPDQLEQLKSELIDELISNAAPNTQRRLKGLQFQIEMERRRAQNPMAACVKISAMMHDSLSELSSMLRAQSNPSYVHSPAAKARVISLHREA